MNGKRLVWYSIGLKLMMVFSIVALAWGQRLISQKWFDPLASHSDKLTAVRYKEGNINARDEFGYTGLMRAIEAADVELVKEFMFRGADIAAVSYDSPSIAGKPVSQHMLKTTALHVAVQSAETRPNEEIEILKFLFTLLRQRQNEGKGTVDIVKLVNAKDAQNNSPIHNLILPTSIEDRKTILKLLLENGADFNAQNAAGDTILHQTVRRNERPWIKYLLSNYRQFLNKDLKNKEGLTVKDLAKNINMTDVLALICSFNIWPCEPSERIGIDTGPLGSGN